MSNGDQQQPSLVDVFASYLDSTGSGPFPGTGPMPANPDALDKFLGMHVTDPIAAIWALLRLLATPPDAPPDPESPLSSGVHEAQESYRQVYQALASIGFWPPLCWLGATSTAVLVLTIAVLGEIVAWGAGALLPPIATAALTALDKTRKELDPAVAGMAVDVLNELLGTDYAATHLPTGGTVADHIARAGAVGHLLHAQLMSEFAGATDVTADKGKVAAERFSGLLVNFGTATGILALLGGLIPQVHLEEVREIAEQVARNLGLGRAHRMVLKVILDPLIVKPYTWYINQRFHPAVFSRGDVLNPFTSTLMSQQAVFDALDLEGFSHDKIEQLIKLHQKRLTLEDVETLRRWAYWSEDQAHKYLVELGWPEELADTAGLMPELRRTDARVHTLVEKVVAAVIDGHMAIADGITQIKALPLSDREQSMIEITMTVAARIPHASMSLLNAQAALEQGLFTIGDLQAWLAQRGYTGDDQATLLQLSLLKFATLQEAKAVAQFAYDAKLAAARKANKPAPPKPAILT
jgi:hypothetical protein